VEYWIARENVWGHYLSDQQDVPLRAKGSVLQCVAVFCSVLQRVAVCCSVRECLGTLKVTYKICHFAQKVVCVAVCCSVVQCVTVCCSVLQCAAMCCSVLQCVAMSGDITLVINTMCPFAPKMVGVAGCCRVLQCHAVL